MTFVDLLARINQVIVNPLIVLMVSLAALIFFFGIVELLTSTAPDKRAQGSRHMMWGVIGMAIMLSVFGIMNFLADTLLDIFS